MIRQLVSEFASNDKICITVFDRRRPTDLCTSIVNGTRYDPFYLVFGVKLRQDVLVSPFFKFDLPVRNESYASFMIAIGKNSNCSNDISLSIAIFILKSPDTYDSWDMTHGDSKAHGESVTHGKSMVLGYKSPCHSQKCGS